MGEAATVQETVPRVPFHWAVTLIVLISLPMALYLGKFNFPVWVCFIVWAEYFALGGTAKTANIILPSLPFGAVFGALWMATSVLYTGLVQHPHSLFVGLVIGSLWVTMLVFLMFKSPIFTAGSLAVFNGLTLFLAVYFTKSIPAIGPMENPYWPIANAFFWSMLMSYIGWFFGWLNVALTFPKAAD